MSATSLSATLAPLGVRSSSALMVSTSERARGVSITRTGTGRSFSQNSVATVPAMAVSMVFCVSSIDKPCRAMARTRAANKFA